MRIKSHNMSRFDNPNSSPSSFRSKLGSYVTGLAIGFLLLGFFMLQKHRSEQRAASQQQINQSMPESSP